MQVIDQKEVLCFHCGERCDEQIHLVDEKAFCCQGCSTVYQILQDNQLGNYYRLQNHPGSRGIEATERFDYLDNPTIKADLLAFDSDSLQKVQFQIPAVHCSSCIWLLEHLPRLHKHIKSSRINFPRKELSVDFDPRGISLKELVSLLASIGYEPHISLEDRQQHKSEKTQQRLSVKIGAAGFCFGNIMLLSFPEYLGMDLAEEAIITRWLSWFMLLLSLPVVMYCAQDYYQSAISGLKQKYLNIDVPIVLGIAALFGRSVYEIVTGSGPGYLDSLAGLLFLLLIGKWFQQRTYRNLSFDRDFKAYFPLAVTKKLPQGQESVLVNDLQVNDVILIRHEELIPADCELLDRSAQIDYSFVSGESTPVTKTAGDRIYAGGRHLGAKASYRVQKPVSQSYLTQLWNHSSFQKSKHPPQKQLINIISKHFTLVVLGIAALAGIYWLLNDPREALFVFTSVLIVACPCALSMASPFTLGNAMRVMGLNKFYLKNTQVIEEMAQANTLVFDKTGTLSESHGSLSYQGAPLTGQQAVWIHGLTSQSLHPMARDITRYLENKYGPFNEQAQPQGFIETEGLGIRAEIGNHLIKVGKGTFVNEIQKDSSSKTYLSIDEQPVGYFERVNRYRKGLQSLFKDLTGNYQLCLLSGDGNREAATLQKYFGEPGSLHFDQSPVDKLHYVELAQQQGSQVIMIGDGLNDAGALQQSNVGIAITDDTNHFTPASDAIMGSEALTKLPRFLKLSQWSRWVIIAGFVLSFLYNVVGLSLAVTANLTPLAAAILMPMSSISVVVLTSAAIALIAKKLKLN